MHFNNTARMENKQPHKRKKRAARALFDRRKVHKKQQTPLSPSLPIPSLSLAAPPSSSLESSIPEKWQVHRDGSETNYYHVVTTASAGTRIALCVTIHPDSTWNVYAYGKEVSVDGNPLFEGVPRCVTLSTTITDLLNVTSRACVCPGNPEENFVEICNKRGGTMRGERGFGPAVAYINKIEGEKVIIVIMYITNYMLWIIFSILGSASYVFTK